MAAKTAAKTAKTAAGPQYGTVKLEESLVSLVKMVAAGRGQSVGEYLTPLVGDLVRRDLAAETEKLLAPGKARKGGA